MPLGHPSTRKLVVQERRATMAVAGEEPGHRVPHRVGYRTAGVVACGWCGGDALDRSRRRRQTEDTAGPPWSWVDGGRVFEVRCGREGNKSRGWPAGMTDGCKPEGGDLWAIGVARGARRM